MVETPEFDPDGKHLLFSTTIDKDPQICRSNLQGGDFQRISNVRFIEVSPKVNPKTGRGHPIHLRPFRPSSSSGG